MYLKKELYELIRADESIFDFIQESSLDGLWYWDLENPENEWMNAKFWTELGYNPDEMPHKSSAWKSIINQEDLKAVNDNFTKHCENPNHPFDQIVRYTHKNSSTVWIRCRGLAIRDKSGKPTRMLGAHQNVTELKRREEELYKAKEKAQESEEKYRAFYNNAPLSFQSLDDNGCFIDINPMWSKTLGYERDEVIGKWYGNFLHPDYVEHFRINFPAFKKRGYVSDVQFRLRKKDNTYIHVSFEGCIGYTPEGKFKQTYCVFKDITEQKALENAIIKAKERAEESERELQLKNEEYKAINEELLQTNDELIKAKEKAEENEEKTRYILKHNPNAIAVFDNQMNLLIVSDRFLDDYDVIDKNIIGRNLYEVFPEIPEKWRNAHKKALQGEVLSNNDDYFIRPDGSITYSRWECRPWYRSDNSIGGMIAYTEVITERKLSEIALKESQRNLQLKNEEYEAINEELLQTNYELIAAKERAEESEKELQLKNEEYEAINEELLQTNYELIAAKEKAEESEAKFKVVVENGAALMTITDTQGVVVFASPQCENVIGWPIADVIGLNLPDFIHPDDTEMVIAEREKASSLKPIKDFEYRIFDKQKNIRWVSHSAAFIKNGDAFYVLSTIMNITERKHAEEKLKTSDRIFNHSIDMLCIAGFDGYFKVLNPAWTRILGWSNEELLSKPWVDFVHPDDIDDTQNIGTVIVDGKEVYQFENRYICKDGTIKWLSWTSFPYTDENIMFGVARDVTERKRTEDKIREKDIQFRKLSSNLPDLIYQFTRRPDGSYCVPIASEGIKNIFGCSPEDVVEDFTPISNVIYPEDAERVLNDIEYSAKHLSYFTCEFRVQIPGRPVQWILSRSTPEKLPDGSVTWYGFNANITERKQAEEELKSVKASLELCLEASQIGIWSHDLIEDPEHIKEVSVRDLKHDQIYGYKEKIASWGQEKMLEHVIDEDREATRKAFDNVFEKGRLDFECRILWPDNTIHWIACGGKVYKDSAGQPNQINGTVMDITERKQAEEKLKLLNRAVESSSVAVEITDAEGNINYVSPFFTELTGYSYEEVLGKNPRFLKSGNHPKTFYEELWNTILSGREWTGEFQNKKKNGELYWEKAIISPILNSNGKVTNFVAIKEDITERNKMLEELIKAKEKAEESEIQIRYSQEEARIGYYIFNIQTGLWSSSEMLDEIFGINNDYVRDLQGWLNLIHPDFQKIMLDYLSVNILSNHEKFDKSYQIINKKTDISYWVHGLGTLEFDKNGKILKMFGTIQDISISKEFEQELIKAKEKAEESDRLKSAFLANMSHEIRTPMNGILGFAYLLKDTDLSGDEQQEYIKIIQKSGKRMLNIINDIIDISKIEAGLMESNINEFNINEQIDYTYTFFKPEAEAKGINLSFKSTLPQTEAIIKTDREKVYAILTNLVKNAIKYTEKGSIEFGYNLKKESEHKQLEFFVKDTGIGIPKDRQEAIFERFIQADIADKEARQGAGLGLAIAKAYVELLGGKIWVESEAGKGSTFYFTLPYNTVAETGTIYQLPTAPDNNNDVRKLKIMIAEDDAVSTRLLEKYLEIFGKEPIKVRTGVDAVETCRNNPDIDLIMMDIQMPDMNGYEATKQIREFDKKVVIISQTAYGLRGDREKSIEAGCNDYISKPIDKELLLSLISKYFE